MSVAFIACVERGNLENQAMLLFRSIRRYGGRYRNSSIYSFQPRREPSLEKQTLDVFRQLDVVHNTDVLNVDFDYYPMANKIFSCARAEEMLTEDILIFLDSDTLFVNEPRDLDLPEDVVAAIRPVDRKIRGSTGPGDPRDDYWRRLYEICNVPETPYVHTSVDEERIRAYWNAGLIAVQRREGLFRMWKKDFETLMIAKHFPPPNRILNNMDQLALAGTLSRVFDRVRILDYRYNYLIPKRGILPMPYRNLQWEELVHIHYHHWFNKPGFLESLSPSLDSQSEIYQWIDGFLPFEPIIQDPNQHQHQRKFFFPKDTPDHGA